MGRLKGLKPGSYQIRATANPSGYIDESDPNNNTVTAIRTIPGTIADAASKNIAHGAATTFPITGHVVAADVPARNNLAVGQGACQDVRKDLGCYLFTSANGPLTFSIGAKPTHGSLTIVSQSGTTANVKYTPQAGFSGHRLVHVHRGRQAQAAEPARHGHRQRGVAAGGSPPPFPDSAFLSTLD